MQVGTLKRTLDMIRAVGKAAKIKIHRGMTDFLADRLMQATTQPSLFAMIEHLISLLQADIEEVSRSTIAEFLHIVNAPEAPGVLRWLREYPRLSAIIVMQRSDTLYAECLQDLDITVTMGDTGTALPSTPSDLPITVTCLSPLAHGADTKAGNATIFRRMQVLSTTGQILSLPFYSGNALRGQLRDLLADHFLSALGLIPRTDDPPCALWFFHALYAGGCLEENSAQAKALAKKLGGHGAIRAEGVHEFRDMIPLLSLLGTALGNRIISGRINVCDLRPQCLEWGNGNLPAGSLFEWSYFTRREDHENHAEGENASMIVNTECLKAGTILTGGINLSLHATEIERSCLGQGLALLQSVGYIGAENRRGLGQITVQVENVTDPQIYTAYLLTKRQEILAYLQEIGAIATQTQE